MTGQKIDYKGREIVIPQQHQAQPEDSSSESAGTERAQNTIEIFVDGKKLTGGLTAGGKFFLNEYAYDPQGSIEDLAKKYVDHLDARIESKESIRQEESR